MRTARYAILHHTGVAEPHYDVMVETTTGGPLLTWRSPVWPIVAPVLLDELPPHRSDYLTYEGPVSNDRGHVSRVAGGTCQVTRLNEQQSIIRFSPTLRLNFVMTEANGWLALPMND